MHFYITYNDAPSGIYSSQVIDVVKYYNEHLNENVKLISFISIRSFFKNRKKIKSEFSTAIVLPMFPKQSNWKSNLFLLNVLCFIYKPYTLIGRSVLATQLALLVKQKHNCKKVVYDGRGAITDEWKEYQVVTNEQLLNEIEYLEKEVVLESDFRIAISNALVNYWQINFNYQKHDHVVIPCTLNKVFEKVNITSQSIQTSRELIGINNNDVLFVYSGSVAGWQSFDLLYRFIKPILKHNLNYKVLFLSTMDSNINKLIDEFKEQIICKVVSPDLVPQYLLGADYGLLIREETTTNLVASPVKFAEYLACGLNVIISDKLGDYSKFVLDNNCGELFEHFAGTIRASLEKKTKNNELALSIFTKNKFKKEYIQVLNSCSQ